MLVLTNVISSVVVKYNTIIVECNILMKFSFPYGGFAPRSNEGFKFLDNHGKELLKNASSRSLFIALIAEDIGPVPTRHRENGD